MFTNPRFIIAEYLHLYSYLYLTFIYGQLPSFPAAVTVINFGPTSASSLTDTSEFRCKIVFFCIVGNFLYAFPFLLHVRLHSFSKQINTVFRVARLCFLFICKALQRVEQINGVESFGWNAMGWVWVGTNQKTKQKGESTCFLSMIR